MLTRPVFRRCYRAEVVHDELVLLVGERTSHALRGRPFAVLARLFAQEKTVSQIVSEAAREVGAAEVYYSLRLLEESHLIREAKSGLSPPQEGFWDCLGVEPAAASLEIGRAGLDLQGLGGVDTTSLGRALESLGFKLSGEGALLVLAADDYLRPDLEAINQRCLRDGRSWVLTKPVGSILWLGPLFVPRETGCWECLAQRLRRHRSAQSRVRPAETRDRPLLPAPVWLSTSKRAAEALLATELAKWTVRPESCRLKGAVLTLDLETLTTERHRLTRRPQCAACGAAESATNRQPQPVRPHHRKKIFTQDGGHRARIPEETLRAHGHHISRVTGVVDALQREPGLDRYLAPVFQAGWNGLQLNGDPAEYPRDGFRTSSGGKGMTETQARASALCEALERQSGSFQGDEIRTTASMRSLGEAAIHPNAAMNFSAAQLAGRRDACGRPYERVPVAFDPDTEIEWSPLWSLTEERFRHLPTAYCYYGYALPAEQRFCWSDSNGCAAGNFLEEAILQGFLELVERDSVALWWYNRVRRKAVDLDSFREPYISELLDYYRSLGRECWVLDITSDLRIPAFAAITRRIDSPSQEITLGYGAHLEPRIGILRALTEANQFLPVVIDRHANPTAAFRTDDEKLLAWLEQETVDSCRYLVPAPCAAIRREDYRSLARDDLKDDVDTCVRIAADHGLETLVLDQTRPDIGLPVVRVVVPGLRHFWPRFGAGRLYDVPVDLGWRSAPLEENNLNPIPVFF